MSQNEEHLEREYLKFIQNIEGIIKKLEDRQGKEISVNVVLKMLYKSLEGDADEKF